MFESDSSSFVHPSQTEDIFRNPSGLPRWRPVSAPELAAPPYRNLCQLEVRRLDDNELLFRPPGSGWRAGSRTVVTAAHAVVPPDNIEYYIVMRFPGLPEAFIAEDLRIPAEWSGVPTAAFDLAVLRIPNNISADLQRSLSLSPLRLLVPDRNIQGQRIEVVGFPGGQQQLVAGAGGIRGASPERFTHTADTLPGHSGSPVLINSPDINNESVVGIHIGGFRATPAGSNEIGNVALTMSVHIAEFINGWVSAWG